MASPPLPEASVAPTLEEALQAGRQLVGRERIESPEDLALAKALDLEKARYDLETLRLSNDNERGLIELRKTYGRNMIRFLWAYFAAAMVLIVLSGSGWFKLPDAVLVALIGGTAVSVLGVVGTIVAGLFKVSATNGPSVLGTGYRTGRTR